MSEKNMLILVPGENARGGITNYYQALRKHLPPTVVYFTRGARSWPVRSGKIREGLRFISDYFRFLKTLFIKDVEIVQTTTAFNRKSIVRDGIFVLLSHITGRKTIVFFRGWDDPYAESLGGMMKRWIDATILKCDAIIDLSGRNVDRIRTMGYKGPTFLETTLVDQELVEGVTLQDLLAKRQTSPVKNILFLSRIEKEKGVFQLLEAYTKSKSLHPNISLTFAGDGSALESLKQLVAENQIEGVTFAGFVSGETKKKMFLEASMFVFLSEFEGMPNAVLEAMAFGLPVITTDVGGIYTVFTDKENGRLLADNAPEPVAQCISDLLANDQEYENYAKNNFLKAKSTFWSGVVGERILKIYQSVRSEG